MGHGQWSSFVRTATPALVVLALALAAWLPLWIRARLRRWSLGRRMRRARWGEERAERILVGEGYVVEGRQVGTRYPVLVDGVALSVELRADYMVRRGDMRFVAEVKTGKMAPRVETPATRRQLLEYRLAFAVDGVLLVDAEAGQVKAIVFPETRPRAASSSWVAGLAWIAVGAVGGALGAAIVGAIR